MKKIVIAGSTKIQDKVKYWKNYFEQNNYDVLDYPQKIKKDMFLEIYPDIHINFLKSIVGSDILFVMNEDKNDIKGYIGYETFAELLFGLSQKLVYNKDIELYILKMPDRSVQCYDEIDLWLKLGWIKIYKEEE